MNDDNVIQPQHERDLQTLDIDVQHRWYEASAVHTTKGAPQ